MAPCKSSHNCSALGCKSRFQFSTSPQNSQLWLRAEVWIMGFPPLNTESGEKRNSKISKMHGRKLQNTYNVSFKIEIKTQSYKYTVSFIKVWNEKGNDCNSDVHLGYVCSVR